MIQALRRILAAGTLISMVLVLVSPISAEEKIRLRVGGIYGLSGPLVDLSTQMKNGAVLASEAINATDSVRLDVHFEDSRWEAKTAVSAFNKLTELDGVNVVHVAGSPMTLAVKPLSEAKGVLLISGGAHPQILKNSKLVLRHANSADLDARVLAEAVLKETPAQVAGLYMENEWAQSFDENFKRYFAEKSKTVVRTDTHLPDETDFRSRLVKLTRSRPDVFIVNSFGVSVGLIMKQLKEIGYKGKIYANNGFALSKDSEKIVRENGITGFHYQTYPDPSDEFISIYQKRFGVEPGIFALITYTDFELITHAAQSTQSNDVTQITSYIKSLGTFTGKYDKIVIGPDGDISVATVVKRFS